MEDIIIKKSKIHGVGVFALRDFKKGEVIIKWDTSHRLNSEEIKKLPVEEQKFLAPINNNCYILQQPPARYVNHSCNSNSQVVDFCDVAKVDIKKGEEITGDYSECETPDFEMVCNCGNKNCHNIIRAS